MHARFASTDTAAATTTGPGHRAVIGRVVPVLLAVLALRAIAHVSRHHGGHRGRRMDRIAELHRELHARDAAADEVTA
jgi:hypothetical protein